MKNFTVITHPLIQQNLTRLRDQATQPEEFRRALGEVAALMVYEATRTFATQPVTVQTPLEKTLGFIGLKRNERTLEAATYHKSLPEDLSGFEIILMDPMLATGGSAVSALDLMAERKAKRVRLVNLLAAPEGIKFVHQHYPEVPIFTAALDRKLNHQGYIVPGLGDAGDRLFGV